MSALSKYPILLEVLRNARAEPRTEPESTKLKRVDWENELASVVTDKAAIAEILKNYAPATSEEFWGWLVSVQLCGGFIKAVKSLTRTVTASHVQGLEPTARQTLLRGLNDRKASWFFNAPQWLTPELIAGYFPVDFIANWVVSRHAAYGEDRAVGELFGLLHKLGEKTPEFAFDLARMPAFAREHDNRVFQIALLGSLRFRSDLSAKVNDQLAPLLEEMRTSPSPVERAHYWRTMNRSLELGRLPDAELDNALAATARSPEEYDVGFQLAVNGAREPTPKAQTIRLLRWLAEQFTQPARQPMHQYNTASAVWLAVEHVTPEEVGFDPLDLLLKLQPIDPTHAGIWQQIETALYPVSHHQVARLHRVLGLLARDHWNAMQKALDHNGPLYGVMVRLSENREETAAFAAKLVASSHPGERRFGFFLIEDLQLPGPKEPGTTFTAEEFTIWLAEFRLNIVYKTVAQQLLNAAARIDPSHEAMVHAFQKEVLYQCKNLPGLCLAQLKERGGVFPVLAKSIQEADDYFAALTKLDKSPIKAMRIPGLWRAVRRKRVRDREKMEEDAAKYSVFAQFAKKSYLLYGSRWATFNGGVLSNAGPLQTSTIATEFPRKVFIDPEGYRAIRLFAQAELKRLEKTEGAGE
ncbi:MAG: hypothetical protein KIT44_00010 [Opitutaceae bacterium]|nr:hypothetical protein [Opitutaceae bacterium]